MSVSRRSLLGVGSATAAVCGGILAVLWLAPRSLAAPVDDLSQLAAAWLAAAAAGRTAATARGRLRLGWGLMAAAFFLWGCGQALALGVRLGVHPVAVGASRANLGYSLSGPLLVAGLGAFPIWPRGRSARIRTGCDGLIVGGGLLMISWRTVLAAVVAAPAEVHSGVVAQVLRLLYPVFDVVVGTLAVVMWARARTTGRVTLTLLLGGLALTVVADSALAFGQATASLSSGAPVDVLRVAGFLMVAMAALHGDRHPMVGNGPSQPEWPGSLLPYAPLPLAVALTLGERVTTGGISTASVVIGVTVFLLVVVRQAVAIQDNRALLRRLQAREQELYQRAEQDALTGLANRAAFLNRVGGELSEPDCESGRAAVVFIDLDDFKQINDTLGHAAGDAAIVAVGRRLRRCLRDHDLVARLGGDEFAVFLTRFQEVGQLATIAQRLIDSLSEPLELSGHITSVAGTIGIALAEPGDGAGELLRRADIAMYAAKARGKGLYGIFEPSVHLAMSEPLSRRAEVAQAVAEHQLRVHYQPIVSPADGTLVGVEALLRWVHPDKGLLVPGTFLNDLEQAGLLVEVGSWVLQRACAEVAALRHHTGRDIFVSVNVSSRQAHDDGFVPTVTGALADAGLDPTALVVELTEEASVGASELVAHRLRAVRDLGVRVALDHFGTGYSALAHLRRLPVDIIKIDRSFIDDLGDDGDAAAVMRAMLALGRGLRLMTVAEGVETQAQHLCLLELGCIWAQGYHYARPGPLERVVVQALDAPRAGDRGGADAGGATTGVGSPGERRPRASDTGGAAAAPGGAARAR